MAPDSRTVPPPSILNVTALVLETTPLTTSVPPAAWTKACGTAAPRIIGASIVFVPEVLSARIAFAVASLFSASAPLLVLVPVSVKATAPIELVISYPDDPAPLK